MTGPEWVFVTRVRDSRGLLTACEWPGPQCHFVAQRVFVLSQGTCANRGGHAHRACAQLLVAVRHNVKVRWHDGSREESLWLNSSEGAPALFVPPMHWVDVLDLDRAAVLMVVCSHKYDPDDYIRDFQEFLGASRAAVRP